MTETPIMVSPRRNGLRTTLADGRTVRAFISVEGTAICWELEAVNGALTRIALLPETLQAMFALQINLLKREQSARLEQEGE